jgi:hypothetical protein
LINPVDGRRRPVLENAARTAHAFTGRIYDLAQRSDALAVRNVVSADVAETIATWFAQGQ